MKPRRVYADLDLEIDGQPAKFTGTGRRMRLEVQEAGVLRGLLRVPLPNFKRAGANVSPNDMPTLLAKEGLTLEVADKRGPLVMMGEEAAGRGYTVPGIGRVNDVALANKRAALRLASSAGPRWLIPALGIGLLVLVGVLLATRRNDD